MNTLKKTLLVSMLIIMGCGGSDDPQPDPIQVRKDLLTSAPWNVMTISQTGINISSAFSGAVITLLENGTFTTTVDADFSDIFPSSGTWSLTLVDVLEFNGIDMNLSNVSSNSVTLTFAYITASTYNINGILGLEGDYVVVLNR